MKLGIIQTRGLGDIVIAAPIAMYYIERGCEVYWPIDSEFIEAFQYAFPKINFLPINSHDTKKGTAEYFYESPIKELNKVGCDTNICLYSHLTGFDLGNERLKNSLSFDAYKYALAKVPFNEKWNLKIKRNPIREGRIFEILNLDPTEKFDLIHCTGSNFHVNPADFTTRNDIRKIVIEPLTSNPFDWLGVIENANALYFIDSIYSNLVEQLNLKVEKSFYLRSDAIFTPCLRNHWKYI